MSEQAKRVAVLGAGPMGLAVAYQLVQDGHQPVVFEADDRVGGMTACFDFNGLNIERYYHFHCTSDSDFLDLLAELNISDKMRWTETKMGFWFENKLQPWGNPIALLRFKGISMIAKIRYGAHAFFATKRNRWQDLDSVEASSWIKRWVGEEAYNVLWKKLLELKFYEFSNNLSAAWIWSRIRRIGRSRYSLFAEKLGYLEGGSETLLSSTKAAIEQQGGEFKLSTPVQQVAIESNKVVGVETANGTELFDTVVSTIPLPIASKLLKKLPSSILEKYQSVDNIAVVCVIAKLKKPVSENFWLNINDPQMDIPGLIEYSNLRPLDNAVVYAPFYMPGDNAMYSDSDEVFTDKVKRYIKRINPEIKDDDFIDIRASRYRFAQPICDPGFSSKLPSIKLPVDGLFVADTSYYYPEDRGISESIGLGRKIAQDCVR